MRYQILLSALIAGLPLGSVALQPGYPHQAQCALTNAARFQLNEYMKKYRTSGASSIGCSFSTGLPPLYLDDELSNAAAAHAQSMAGQNCFQHETCGSCGAYGDCNFASRLKYYFPRNADLAENIAAGTNYQNPFEVVAAWIKSAGHCQNIMTAKYDRIGVGYADGNDAMKTRAVQDFAAIGSRPGHLACGGHVPASSAGQVGFIVSGDFSNLKNAGLVLALGAERHAMRLDIGSRQRGMFRVDVTAPTSGCASYSFILLDGNQIVETYPSNGKLMLNGVNGCEQSPVRSADAAPSNIGAAADGASANQGETVPETSSDIRFDMKHQHSHSEAVSGSNVVVSTRTVIAVVTAVKVVVV